MSPRLLSFLKNIVALVVIVGTILFVLHIPEVPAPTTFPAEEATTTAPAAAAAAVPVPAPAPEPHPKSEPLKTTPTPATTTPQEAVPEEAPANQVLRIENPYPFPQESVADINAAARSALVNILCTPRGGSLSPISGSGVLIDPRGVILTNAHVAQYVLLSQDPRVNLSCVVRIGGPARAQWVPGVLYIPSVWVDAHASEIRTSKPIGTGEHDYALLIVTASATSAPPPPSFPFIQFDTRDAIGFEGDKVLVASYPAEFLGGIAARYNLFPASSVATIGSLLTFAVRSVDAISLGGIIEAQSGSSGGAVVNAWGRLIGLISTTSSGATTAERDLHALTLSYINRDLNLQSGASLSATLDGNIALKAQVFSDETAPALIETYLDILAKPH